MKQLFLIRLEIGIDGVNAAENFHCIILEDTYIIPGLYVQEIQKDFQVKS